MSDAISRYFAQDQNIDSMAFVGVFDRQLSSITPIAVCQTQVKANHITDALNKKNKYDELTKEIEDKEDQRMNAGQALKTIFTTGESND